MAIDANRNVAVTGESGGAEALFDVATILYDTDGNEFWVPRFDGGRFSERGRDVAFGLDGEVYMEVALEHLTRAAYGQGGARDWSRLEADQARIRITGFVIRDNGQYYLTMGHQAVRLDHSERLSVADRMKLRFAADHSGRARVFGQINRTLPPVKDRKANRQKLFTVNLHRLSLL